MLGGAPPTHLLTSSIYGPLEPIARVRWSRVATLFRPYRARVAVVVASLAVLSLLGLVPALAARLIVDHGLSRHRPEALLEGVGLMAAAAVASLALTVFQGRLAGIIAEGVLLDVRQALLAALLRAPLAFFAERRSGEIVNRVFNDPNAICTMITATLSAIATNAFIMLTSVAAMLVLDPKLALVAIAALPLMVIPLRTLGRQLYPIRRRTLDQRDQMHAFVEETVSLRGAALIKAFGREEIEVATALAAGRELMDTEVRLETAGRWFTGAVNALAILGPAAVWLIGGYLFFAGGASVGTIVAFVALLGRIYAPASALAGVHVQLVGAMAIFERVFAYLDLAPEAPVERGGRFPTQPRGAIAFDGVRFAYGDGRVAVDGVDFEVEPGTCVAIVGGSGAGKTTLANLLLRFYDPSDGAIRVDGIDLREWDLRAYRALIGVVQQETLLCHDTIANNVRYGRIDASDDEVVAAAVAANVHDAIAGFPDGYQTLVGEGGHRMSGGERQRVAIARALLRDPRILVLDEATSSLDAENERLVQAALRRLMRGRTSVVIAHRLSTIERADRIVVLDRGRIVDAGTHVELLLRSEHYARLYGAPAAGTAASA